MGLIEEAKKKLTLHLLQEHTCSSCKYSVIHNGFDLMSGQRVLGWTWCVNNSMDVDLTDSCRRYDRKERDAPTT